VHAVIDYRPALRQRSGVGEYTHELARALVGLAAVDDGRPLDLTLFSSSWKDRVTVEDGLRGASFVDRRIPVTLLNLAWHRFNWPPVETIARGRFDIAHSMHPLLMPAQNAARIITIHDLDFLSHPERTRAEIRRDYPALARAHARRADAIIAVSQFTAAEVQRHFGVPADRVSVCPPGAPPWTPREQPPANGYVLFFGTLEPRKNVGGLLDAYQRLSARRRDLPRLVLAGLATDAARPWLDRIQRPPLDRLVTHIGYVDPTKRRALYQGAICLVQPSFEEGFGIPVLEAMTIGVPVVVTNRGALPEVTAGAGEIVSADDPDELAAAIERLVDDPALAAERARLGLARAGEFRWNITAQKVYDTYASLYANRHRRP
jgi:glycosyltransferase involved in cell wall biosynthesis